MTESRTVYLLDDDASARKGLSHLLSAAGYRVRAFSSSEGFIKIKTIDTHACLVMDAGMSGVFELDQQKTWFRENVSIPVIVLSARDDKESRERARESKAVGFFRKPVDGPALLDAIEWALETDRRDITAEGRA